MNKKKRMHRLNRFNKSADSGFTLIEILITITVFSIIMTLLFSSVRAFLISAEAVKTDVTARERSADVYHRISRDLQGLFALHPPRYQKPGFDSDPDPFGLTGEVQSLGTEVFSSVRFASSVHCRTGADRRLGIAQIAYYIRESRDGSFDLYRADALRPYPEEIQSCLDPVLAVGLSEFSITYYNVEGDAFETWDSESGDFDYAYPVRMDFKIGFAGDERSTVQTFTIALTGARGAVE